MEPIGQGIKRVIRRLFSARYGTLFAEVIISWPKIVGLEFYDKSWPIKIISLQENRKKINVLYVGVINSAVGLQISYRSNLIIEALSLYFGHQIIDRIKVR